MIAAAEESVGMFWEWAQARLGKSTHALPTDVSLSAIMEVMSERINLPSMLAGSLPAGLFDALSLFSSSIPPHSVQPAARWNHPLFTRPFSYADVAAAKGVLAAKRPKLASGPDRLTYRRMLRVDNTLLCELFNKCITEQTIPTYWLVASIVAVPKHGKNPRDPKSYRHISLESCALKMLMTMIAGMPLCCHAC